MSTSDRKSPQPWRSNGAPPSKSSDGERLVGQGQGHHIPQHQHHHHRKERLERDRDKNHETVCNLLSMLTLGMDQQPAAAASSSAPGSAPTNSVVDHNRLLLLNLTNSPESCIALRRAGCIPLLIEILYPPSNSSSSGMQPPEIVKTRAARALKNIVQFNPDEKLKRNELRVWKLLEGIRAFSEAVRVALQALGKDMSKIENESTDDGEKQTEQDPGVQDKVRQAQRHPTSNMTTLMKLSFDEEHRNIMCLLGAIHALADLIVCDHLIHGNAAPEMTDDCLLIRRYCGMTLINLTVGDGVNKALLFGMKEFMRALVSQLECNNEDVCQVTASIFSNLAWRADSTARASLKDCNAVPKLTLAAIKSTKESTLKWTLSALWRLSAHSVSNMSAICTASPGALPFLISLLRPNNPIMKSLKTPMTIIENAGGIIRNISPHVSTSPDLRRVLRENHCYEILLEHLKSCSFTVVSNACGTLWNLSGGVGCEEDQRKLLDLNAVPMLKNLIYSKNERISQGASAALRNLLSSRFAKDHMLQIDSRLTAQIYSPNAGSGSADRVNNCVDSNQESPGSDGDFEFEYGGGSGNQHRQQQARYQQQQQLMHHPPMVHPQEPPVAHQQPSTAAASIYFHRGHSQPPHVHPAPQSQFHPANFAHPVNYVTRPTSINYSVEQEPLDLTLTSAKSSPIHIISAAEFGIHHHLHHSQPHHRKPKSAPFTHGGSFHGTASSSSGNNQNVGGHKAFFNPPSLLHQTGNTSQYNRFNYPGAKFNRSCPEILSRLNSGHGHGHAQMNNFLPPEQKPLDFSSNSHSASSSLRGADEAAGTHNDSATGCDTTFDYSLQYTEEDEDGRRNTTGNREEATKLDDADTLKTYCYEGTPHNFSTSNSCQDLVHEVEMEKAASAHGEKTTTGSQNKSQKLQPIDEAPKSYYVENTPAVFSRTSSLSSINSSGGLNVGENKAEPFIPECQESLNSDEKKALDDCHDGSVCHPQQNHPQPKRRSGGSSHPHQQHFSGTGSFTPGRVTFSAEETPLMFSRCSSVASLDSLEVGVVCGGGGGNGPASHNDDDLSDFSRRASEVVSPSDLPDSPRAMAPPVRVYDQPPPKVHSKEEEKMDGDDDVKIFSMEEKSGLNSCRSLSPLMIDGEVLPVLGKRKLESDNNGPINNCGSNKSCNDGGSASSQKGPLNVKEENSRELRKSNPPSETGKKEIPYDEVKVFAMEGTPFYGVSNATSLSDLMADLDTADQPPPKSEENETEKTNLPSMPNAVKEANLPVDNANRVEMPVIGLSGNDKPNHDKDEPIYSDVQLLQKCIRIGKAAGIPKSKSEYKISNNEPPPLSMASASNVSTSSNNVSSSVSKKPLVESKSQHDFDDPDLAALIMRGRNRPKEKEKSSKDKVSKTSKSQEKEDTEKSSNKSSSESDTSKSMTEDSSKNKAVLKEIVQVEIKEIDEKTQSDISDPKSGDSSSEQTSTEESHSRPEVEKIDNDHEKANLKMDSLHIDPSQISTTSLGSEWNDETPTFSSPIPSMSISTAFKIAGGGNAIDESIISSQKPSPPAPGIAAPQKAPNKLVTSMQSSMLTNSIMNNEMLDNIDPPSTFSNVISSSDCVLQGSPPLNSRQGSASDKLSRKWKALNDGGNTSSIHSNLSGQRPPIDLDLENSMISVASIKSEIYELSSSYTNEIFQSAMEDMPSPTADRILGDTSLGGNTYTIFPPENMVGEHGKSADVISEGGNTVVSDDFTDAEEIEDYETAPADDNIGHIIGDESKLKLSEEKGDTGKPEIEVEHNVQGFKEEINEPLKKERPAIPPSNLMFQQQQPQSPQLKPLMEVHPLESGNKYGTFKVTKSPMSPRASPKQKRRDDPERYKTHTIAALQSGKSLLTSQQQLQRQTIDNNGNPLESDTRFATFRVGGPKIAKPVLNVNNTTNCGGSVKSSQSNSPESTPGNSPKGIRGRRKLLYSSLPPSVINSKKKAAPPIPPKPTRNASPVRPPSASGSTGGCSGVYVRPTRTSELRIAANSRDNSAGGTGSKTSSNSSLNLIHGGPPKHSSSFEHQESSTSTFASPKPKIAPKPPVRTTASASSASSAAGGSGHSMKPFSGSSYNVLIKTSNSSFGFGQQAAADGIMSHNMKGYSTLPKSSKLGGEYSGMYMPGAVPASQNGESKESIPGSEKSQGKMGKLTNLFKKMDFHRNSKDSHKDESQYNQTFLGDSGSTGSNTLEKKSSKFNFFGRKKDKDKTQPKPFLDSAIVSGSSGANSGNLASAGVTASVRGYSGIWVRRDGENKAMVAPFNYVPPPGHIGQHNAAHHHHQPNNKDQNVGTANNPTTNSHNAHNMASTENVVQVSNSSAAGSAKITTV